MKDTMIKMFLGLFLSICMLSCFTACEKDNAVYTYISSDISQIDAIEQQTEETTDTKNDNKTQTDQTENINGEKAENISSEEQKPKKRLYGSNK